MSDTSALSPPVPPRRPWLRRLAIAAATFVGLVVVAWLAVPPIVRSQLESRLTEALGRKTTVEAVAFDPFRLRVTVRKLAIADGDRPAPLLAFDELVADLSTASIWHRAPVLDALRIVRPAVSLSRDRDGRYNVQDLVDRASAEPDGATPRFSLNNIEVDDGVIAFDDGVAGRKHRTTGRRILERLDFDRPLGDVAGGHDGQRRRLPHGDRGLADRQRRHTRLARPIGGAGGHSRLTPGGVDHRSGSAR